MLTKYLTMTFTQLQKIMDKHHKTTQIDQYGDEYVVIEYDVILLKTTSLDVLRGFVAGWMGV